MLAPVTRALRQTEAPGDAAEAVAGGPAHDARKGMHALGAAQFPDAGIRHIVGAHRPLAQAFHVLEDRLVGRTLQALVEKGLGTGQDGRAEDIVLHLAVSQVADPHRPHAAIAGQPGRDVFFERILAPDAVHRLQRRVAGIGDDVEDIAEVALHGARDAQAVERMDDEIGVAQPAETVIPVAYAAGRFGNRSGHGGDDRAGVVEGVQLQGDGGADHHVLPFEGNGQAAHPVGPVAAGIFVKRAAHFMRRTADRLVRSHQQGQAVMQVRRDARR